MISTPKILFLESEKSPKKTFKKFLQNNYELTIKNYVLPSIVQSRLGKFNFSDIEDVYSLDWNEAIGDIDLQDEITYRYGIDFFSDDLNKRSFIFKHCMVKYLTSLGLSVKKNKSIKSIINSQQKPQIFISEVELQKYDIIIIDGLFSSNTSESILFKYGNGEGFPLLLQYRIAPALLFNVLRSHQKILFLMDYDSQDLTVTNDMLSRFNRLMNRIGICSYHIADSAFHSDFKNNPELLFGIDFEHRLEESLNEFSIIFDSKYKEQIEEKYSPLYKGVNRLFLKQPIALKPDSKNNIENKNKIILLGNQNTTRAYPGWDESIYDGIRKSEVAPNVEKIKFKKPVDNISTDDPIVEKTKEFKNIRLLNEYDHLKDLHYFKYSPPLKYDTISKKIKPTFGIRDVIYNSEYLMLTGNIFEDHLLSQSACDNNIFMKNSISFLSSPVEKDIKAKSLNLPEIFMYKDTGQIRIEFGFDDESSEEVLIILPPMQFCYYRYFLENALNRIGKVLITEEPGSEYNKESFKNFKDFRISSVIIRKIIDYYMESFPSSRMVERLEEMFTNGKITPYIKQTFNPHISEINKEINSKLSNKISQRLIELIQIVGVGHEENRKYSINLPSDNINIL